MYLPKRPLQMFRKQLLKLRTSYLQIFCYHWRTILQTNCLATNISRNYPKGQLIPIWSQTRWFFLLRLAQCSYLAYEYELMPTMSFFQLGILLNSMKRLLDVLWPKIENQLKSWSSCIPDDGHGVIGEHLDDVTVMLRAKFRNYRQAIVEKLSENVSRASLLQVFLRSSLICLRISVWMN